MTNKEQENISSVPSFDDKEFWQDFNKKLAMLAREAEPSDVDDETFFDQFDESENSINVISAEYLRKEDCFSVLRCSDIAETRKTLNDPEKVHLENCQHCQRLIRAFSRISPQPVEVIQPQPADSILQKVGNLTTRLYEQFLIIFSHQLAKSPRLAIRLSLAGIILFIGVIVFFVFKNKTGSTNLAERQTPVPAPSINLKKNKENNVPPIISKDSDELTVNKDNSPKEIKPIMAKSKKPIIKQKETNSSRPLNEVQNQPSFAALDWTGIPNSERETLEIALSKKEITKSDDFKRLQLDFTPLTTQGMKLFSPNREAILESRPEFRWEKHKGVSYQIAVLDEEAKPIKDADAQNLTENKWTPPNELPPGFYFWKVTALNKEDKEVLKTEQKGFFQIVDKSKFEKIKIENKSNMVKAAYFAHHGLLAEAERELQAELKINPRSKEARKLLRKVRELRK